MINYKILNDSIEYFQSIGYSRIETPWIVSDYINNLTKPANIPSLYINNYQTALVGSGEQSFLQLYLLEQLPKGQFQTITPCFRDDMEDLIHRKYFIKNELIKTDIVNNLKLEEMISKVYDFYKRYFGDKLRVDTTNEGFDITINNIELGSYGIRENKFLKYIYGTGVAEPRFSKIVELYGIS